VAVAGVGDVTGFNVRAPSSTIDRTIVMSNVWPSVWRLGPDGRYTLNTDLVVSADMTSLDPQTVVYRINPRAVWSDGVPIDAEDFVYAWQVSRPGAVDIDGSPIVIGQTGPDPIANVSGSDDGKTVTIVYKTHYRLWQAQFAVLMPAHIAKRVGWNHGFDRFDPNVVISGAPFKIAGYNPGKELTLVPNDHYWAPPPKVASVVFRFVDAANALSAIRNGEVDVADLFEPGSDTTAQIQATTGFKTVVAPGPSQEYVGFNLRNELLALPEVRQAFALALDRPLIVERVLGHEATVGDVNSHLFPNGSPSYRDTSGGRYDRADVNGARRLLEGAGFVAGPDGIYARDGKRLSFRLRTSSDTASRSLEEQLVQAQAKAAGIELRIDDAPLNTLLPQLRNGDYDVDVLQYPKNNFGSVNSFRTGNIWNLSDPRVDQLVAQSMSELDDAAWQGEVDQLDALLWEDMPFVPLYQVPRVLAVRDTVRNVQDNVVTTLGPFWDMERWASSKSR
jgi:peptide/nickel transport system substrate-binding protein